MTITCQAEVNKAADEMRLLRWQVDRLGDELATAKLWNSDRDSREMDDTIECIEGAIDCLNWLVRERDEAIADYEREQDGGREPDEMAVNVYGTA